MTVSYTARDQDWTPPVELPKQLNSRLNFNPGYALSANGKRIYITCAKSPTIGGYDIFTSELKGTVWSNPENLTLPINSKTHDGSPSFTTDGNTIYFMPPYIVLDEEFGLLVHAAMDIANEVR